MPDLTPEMLDRISTRAKAATPGPYKACGDRGGDTSCSCSMVGNAHVSIAATLSAEDEAYTGGDGVTPEQARANARYFASVSPNVVLALVEEIRMHRDCRARVTAGLAACGRALDSIMKGDGA